MNIERLAISIMATDATASVFNRVTKNIGNITKKVKDLYTEGEKFQAFSKGIGEIGKYGAYISGSIGALTGAHQKIMGLANLQDSMNQIKTLRNMSEDEATHFRSQIFKIASETGRGHEEILAASIEKLRDGMSNTRIFESLKLEGKYATAGFVQNLGTVSNAMNDFKDKMKLTEKEAEDSFALSAIYDISKKTGGASFESMLGSASSLLTEASTLGMSENKGIAQVMSAVKIASRGSTGEAAASSVQGFLSELSTARAEGKFSRFGIDFDMLNKEALASSDYIGHMFKKIQEATGGNAVEMNTILSKSSRDLALKLSKNSNDYNEMWKNALKADHTEATKDAGTAVKSIGAQWKIFNSQLTAAMDNNVTPLLESLTSALGFFTKDTWYAKTAVTALLITFGGGIAAKAISGAIEFGTKVKGVIHSIKTSDGAIAKFAKATGSMTGKGFKAIGSGLKIATTATWKFVASLWAQAAAWAATPIGMITIAITAIVTGAILIWKNWDKVKKFFADTWNWFTGLWKKMPGWLQWCFPLIKITTIIIKNWDKIKSFFKGLFTTIKTIFKAGWDWISSICAKFKDAGKNIILSIWNGIKSLINKPIEAVKNMVGKIRKFLPFSPAKEGPLRDIHRLKFSETIAASIKDAPLLNKMTGFLSRATKPLRTAATTAVSAGLSMVPGIAAPKSAPIHITINIDAKGASPGAAQDIQRAIQKAMPQIERALQVSQERRARASNTGKPM
jgi:hypothetical protein